MIFENDFVIYYPDGWDRSAGGWNYSCNEFMKRVCVSTVMTKNPEFNIFKYIRRIDK